VQTLESLIGRFGRLSVLVVGDAILDVWLRGRATRLSREAPVPVVDLDGRVEAHGGAANAAVNAASLGAHVTLLSVVGDDPAGARLRERLEASGVGVAAVVAEPGRSTPTKRRVLADGQLLVRVDDGDEGPVGARSTRRLADRLRRELGRHDAVLVSDYRAGTIGPRLHALLAEAQAAVPRTLIVDAKQPGAYRSVGATAAKPNYEEATQLLGIGRFEATDRRAEQLERQGRRILDLLGTRIAAVSLDADGALLCEGDAPPYRTYARRTSGVRATGAGDTFAATLTLALAAGADAPAAAELASAAAGIATGRDGTAVCPGSALREAVATGGRRVADLAELVARVGLYRQEGRRVVVAGGCFDLLHRGHVAYLNQAKALGDVLVVAVNADASVRRLKGDGRPLNPLEDRLAVLAALSCIDHLVAFEEDTPAELLRALRPDVFAKGGDYRPDTVPEAPLVEALGGRVEILPYLEARSTSGMIARLRAGTT
jgi:D-beta-D-heptose 7-phosphate kinase / D-beta-D-heptose 1-phosphate adenosyltransferase